MVNKHQHTGENPENKDKSLSENKSISRYAPKIDQPEPIFKMLEKKPITPSDKELRENTPSRSAKLRYVVKMIDFYDFLMYNHVFFGRECVDKLFLVGRACRRRFFF